MARYNLRNTGPGLPPPKGLPSTVVIASTSFVDDDSHISSAAIAAARGGTGRTTSGVPELCALSSGSITSTFSALIAGAVNGEPVPGDVEREFRHRPAGGERLLRYCARPPFALERLQQRDAEHLLYAASKPGPGDCGPQLLTPLQLIDRLAALAPPPRVHRHRYYGVLAAAVPPTRRHRPMNRSAVAPLAMPGRCCWPASTKCSRSAAPNAGAPFGSSPGSQASARAAMARRGGRLAPASANRPEVCSSAPHCRAVEPEICLTTAWAEDRQRSLAT